MRQATRLVVALPLLVAGCLRSIGPTVSGTVDLASAASDTLRMVYLGSGGWIMQHRGESILTGPLFSNPGLFRVGLLTIRSDTALVDRYMSRYDVSGARAILVGHAHYDHLMDVPRVATHHAPAARIVGSRTVANTLGAWSGLDARVDVVNEIAGDAGSPGSWLRYGDGVRVMALRSHHAPHFDGYTLYQGSREAPRAVEPTWATDWVDGLTYAFLVDFVRADDSVAFRIYVQDAVSPPPAGMAPEAVIADRPVDVAILVPATFDQVDWHPEAFIENLRPRMVLLGHWEDFFVPIENPTRSIRLSDLRHFERRLERVFDGQWERPELWTEFRISGR